MEAVLITQLQIVLNCYKQNTFNVSFTSQYTVTGG